MKTLMESELFSATEVIKACYEDNKQTLVNISAAVHEKGIYDIITAARGTSHHAAICFKVFSEVLAGYNVSHTNPSTLNAYEAKIDMSKSLFVVISQSGGSPDTINMLQSAKDCGALTVAVTNNENSKVIDIADFTLFLKAGEEKAVAATKTFTTELIVLLQLAAALGKVEFSIEDIIRRIEVLTNTLPDISLVSNEISKHDKLIILSRGVTEGIARECGLKLTETTYKMTFTGSANEFQHGPKALIENGTPVVMLAPKSIFTHYYCDIAKEFKKQGAFLIALTDIDDLKNTADLVFTMPETDFYSVCAVYAVAIQALALYTAEKMGLNPDAPRNLNKVTITK